ncbi:hypothetical protein Q9L58_001526 [Maublancomyces gigas]|uniref:CHAT domain-containing protein n=1 Tax=Discina gigas TaxID=1032678 RepID=A0ABR3GU86_9PEZI
MEESLVLTPAHCDLRAGRLNKFSVILIIRFSRLGQVEDSETAILASNEALAMTPLLHPDRPHMLAVLGCALADRSDSGNIDDLDKAIYALKGAAEEIPVGNPWRGCVLDVLGGELSARFELLGGVADLQEAVTTFEDAVAAISPDEIIDPLRLASVSNILIKRFVRLGNLEDLRRGMDVINEAMAIAPLDHPDRCDLLNSFGFALYYRFLRFGSLEDIEKAIQIFGQAVATTPPHRTSDRAMVLIKVSGALMHRYFRLGHLQDLDNAIRASDDVTAKASPKHKGIALSNLSTQLLVRFNRLGSLSDLTRVIQVNDQAISITAMDDPWWADLLENVSSIFGVRFTRFGDLDATIRGSRMAVAVTPLDAPGRVITLKLLADDLHTRFRRLGNVHDLNSAMELSEEAVAKTPLNHPNRPILQYNLSWMLDTRFGRLGKLGNPGRSIRSIRGAITATPLDHIDLASILAGLANLLCRRFLRLGSLQDLHDAIQASGEAVARTPLNDRTRVSMLNCLSDGLYSRYGRLNALEDLERAIQASEQAIAATPPDHPDLSGTLSDYSRILATRFTRLRVPNDLYRAFRASEEGVVGTLVDHPYRARGLSQLGQMYSHRFELLGGLQEIDNSIRLIQEAITITPADDPEQSCQNASSGQMFHGRFIECGDLANLNRAILAGEAAINVSDKSNLGHELLFLAIALWDKSKKTLSPSDIAPGAFRSECLAVLDRWEEASSILGERIKILPTLSPQFLDRDDQEHSLSIGRYSYLAMNAVSVALHARSTTFACLSLLELGRGIIMGLAIDYRGDLSGLQEKSPDLYIQFNCLRTEKGVSLFRTQRELGYSQEQYLQGNEDQRRRRVQAIQEVETVLGRIRQLPCVEGFRLLPSFDKLTAMAVEGAIIVVNTSQYRRDALIVTKTTIKSISLPKLVFKEAIDRIKELAQLPRGKRSTYRSQNADMERLLMWLWDVIVEPVLGELELAIVKEESRLPRVWWIGVGPLARALFHAAGDHSSGSTRNTLSLTISSYIPTIKALSYARQRKLGLTNTRHLLISMPPTPDTPAIPGTTAEPDTPAIPGSPAALPTLTTPAIPRTHGRASIFGKLPTAGSTAVKWKPLKNTAKELDEIWNVASEESSLITRLDSPSTAQVLENLPDYHIIHLACHGISDGNRSSESHLLLHCSDNPPTPEKITVAAISSFNLKNAQVAYLSACSTADNASSVLADESIHIASGFQLAGFSHVLATLWDSEDDACRLVAVEFYRKLYGGQNEEGHRAVCTAFHYAVKELRKGMLGQPIK